MLGWILLIWEIIFVDLNKGTQNSKPLHHTLKGISYPSYPRVPLPLPSKNPYPYSGVRVLEGKGKGSSLKPQGYPCQSLKTVNLDNSCLISWQTTPKQGIHKVPYLATVTIQKTWLHRTNTSAAALDIIRYENSQIQTFFTQSKSGGHGGTGSGLLGAGGNPGSGPPGGGPPAGGGPFSPPGRGPYGWAPSGGGRGGKLGGNPPSEFDGDHSRAMGPLWMNSPSTTLPALMQNKW